MSRKSGAALVTECVAGRAAARAPLAANALAALGDAIPASLAAWLAFDSQSPSGEVSLVNHDALALRSTKELFEELVTSESKGEEWEDDTRGVMNEIAETLPGDALLLRAPCGQDHFLYLGKRLENGECAVLAIEHQELWVAWSGFDAYVAAQLDRLPAGDPEERAARKAATTALL